MTRAIRLTSTLVLGALFVVILLHLSFKAHVFELLSTGFAVSSLENSVASPWYAFLLHGIHFSSSESDLFVVIDLAADTRKFIDVNLVWYDVFTSPHHTDGFSDLTHDYFFIY